MRLNSLLNFQFLATWVATLINVPLFKVGMGRCLQYLGIDTKLAANRDETSVLTSR